MNKLKYVIRSLGGPAAVARFLERKTDRSISRQLVRYWGEVGRCPVYAAVILAERTGRNAIDFLDSEL